MNTRNLLGLLIIVAIGVVGLLIFLRFTQRKISVNTISGKDIIFKPTKKHQFFFELDSDRIIKAPRPTWLDIKISTKNIINKDGLNERYDYSIQKPPKTFRIITLGNSFTYGKYVETSKNYSELLEDDLNSSCGKRIYYEVLNLGVPGYDISYAAQRYELRGKKYNPDLVIWLVHNSDFRFIGDITYKYLVEHKFASNYDERAVAKVQKELGNRYEELAKKFGKDYVLNYQLDAIREVVKSSNNKFIIVGMNESGAQEYLYTPLKNSLGQQERADLYKFDFSLLTKNDGIYPDSHPNQKGHGIIENEIVKILRTEKIIDCPLDHSEQ